MEEVHSASSFWDRVLPWRANEPRTEEPNFDEESRAEAASPAFDIGSQTIAGRAKSALGAVNQDCVVVRREARRDREVHVLIVADGVTHARVGAGERASGLACERLVSVIGEQIRSFNAAAPIENVPPDWQEILERACLAASAAVVTEALSLPDRPEKINDNDLMSTTALIGILDGDELHLANVGDSRAYLVANGIAEQLTVDGDVAASQLAAGIPPEQVQELGSAGKALRFCLGACRETPDGQLVVDPERSRPRVTRWKVMPGDTMVLCSDGLVEERVFLEPEDLVAVIEAGRDASSQQLAERLVAAADAKQRLPSQTEPNGYGDNITCLVLRLVSTPPRAASSGKG